MSLTKDYVLHAMTMIIIVTNIIHCLYLSGSRISQIMRNECQPCLYIYHYSKDSDYVCDSCGTAVWC